MNVNIYARGANPAVDRRIQRKSLSYCTDEVNAGRAEWVDPTAPSKGIICRDFLYFGEKIAPAQPEQLRRLSSNSLPPREVSVRFDDPIKNLQTRAERHCLVVRAEAYARFCDLEPAHV